MRILVFNTMMISGWQGDGSNVLLPPAGITDPDSGLGISDPDTGQVITNPDG